MRNLKPVTRLTDEQRREMREVCVAARKKIARGELYGHDFGERHAAATANHCILALLDERDELAAEVAKLRAELAAKEEA